MTHSTRQHCWMPLIAARQTLRVAAGHRSLLLTEESARSGYRVSGFAVAPKSDRSNTGIFAGDVTLRPPGSP